MRISSQNNMFLFNLPLDIVESYLDVQFEKLMEKNFIPYESVVDYINSTIKEITFPGASYEFKEQHLKYGKIVSWKDSKNVLDTFTNELDITFRSVDSHLNYFILLQVLTEFYLNVPKHQVPGLYLHILDKDGALIYTIIFEEVLFKSISEIRLAYQNYDVAEKTFTVSFRYNFLNVDWELDDDDVKTSKSIFDIPINFNPGRLDNI